MIHEIPSASPSRRALFPAWPLVIVAVIATASPLRATAAPGSAAGEGDGLSLLPVPSRVEQGDGFLSIEQSFTVSFDGFRNPLLDREAARFIARLRAKTGVPVAAVPSAAGAGTLRIRCAGADPGFLTDRADERYTLEVTESEATPVAGQRGGLQGSGGPPCCGKSCRCRTTSWCSPRWGSRLSRRSSAGRRSTRRRVTSLCATLKPYLDEVAANDSVVAAFTVPHPPHGLTIAIVPGISALVEAAAR